MLPQAVDAAADPCGPLLWARFQRMQDQKDPHPRGRRLAWNDAPPRNLSIDHPGSDPQRRIPHTALSRMGLDRWLSETDFRCPQWQWVQFHQGREPQT